MANSLVKLTLESNQYERKMKDAQKQWNDFMRGMGMSVSKFTAVSAAVTAVSGALKVAKDAFFANEKQLDEWGRTVESSKSVYNGFLSAINTGDISGFLSNIDQIVSAARDAYNALDELNTFKAYNQVQDARSRANYAKALDEYKLNPTAENKAALAAANQAVIDNIKAEQTYTMNAYTEALDKLATERGLKGSQRSDFINMFKNKSYNELLTIKNKYDEGKAGRQLYYGDRVLGGKIQNRDTGVWREMEENEKKEFEFARALNQLNDEQIQATQALGKQAEMLDEAVWNQNRAYNRLAGNNAGKGGGSGKVSGGRVNTTVSNDPTYAIDSIAAQQAQVTELNKKWRESAETVRNDVLVQLIAAENKLKQMNNQATLFRENQEGKLLGGNLQTSGLGNITGIAGIGAGLSDEVMEKIRQMQLGGNNVKKSWESAASAVASVGSAMMGIQDPAAKIIGTIGQAVASIALGYATATAQASEMGPWAWVAFAASGLAQMVSMIATIHSATGYAQGGIVDGNSYSGDNIPIMANAGELVLTKAAQASLANHLEGGGMSGLGPSRISGEQIYITLNRYLKRSGQGELMTWG